MWNRLSLVSPYLKSEVVQVNTIIASDSIYKLNESNSIDYFTIKTAAIGPVEDDLTGGIIVINYEASLDTTINKRTVDNLTNYIADVGGFVAFLLMIAYTLVTVWNVFFLEVFLVTRIFEKKHKG